MYDTSKDPLEEIFKSEKIEPFIRKIVFTNFKNISPLEELIFTYPISVLVGQNGTNKTSALIALYGAVKGKTPAEFWFTTSLDNSILDIENENQKAYTSYYYTYKAKDYTAEVLLVNNQRNNRTTDYWETDRPRKQFGMNTNIENISSDDKSQTRWNKIVKKVIYINFRSELSAFDRCLYHANKPSKHFKTKQDYIRAKSLNLKKSIASGTANFKLNGKDKITLNKKLHQEEVNAISKILDKEYESIQYIEHTFFDVTGGSAYIKIKGLNYSEAYAGSGEFAVISLITKIMGAPDHSLILLDEPEVSLHPNAQKKLVDFLIEQVKFYKHQIVISTHSPEIVEKLPDKAIKLFSENIKSSQINIHNDVDKLSVFNVIGKLFNKRSVYVEDTLAKAIIDKAIKGHQRLESNFEVQFHPGGSQGMIKRFLVLTVTNPDLVPLILFDGDQKSDYYKARNSFPSSCDILDKDLKNTIKEKLEFEGVKFSDDSNTDVNKSRRKFIDNLNKYVTYLPFDSPENFILKENKLITKNLNNREAKKEFEKLTLDEVGDTQSTSIFVTQKRFLNKIDDHCEVFTKIRQQLSYFLKNETLENWDLLTQCENEKAN